MPACASNGTTVASGSPSGTVELYNNTFQDSGAFNIGYGGTRGIVVNDGAYSAVHVVGYNNLAVQPAGQPYLDNPYGPVSMSFTDCYGNGACPAGWSSSLSLDPVFVDNARFGDLHFTSASPAAAKSSGHATGATTDLDGKSRPGTGTSLGAYEPPL